MNQQCLFCFRNLRSIQELVDIYKENHDIRTDNSSTFDRYVDSVSKGSTNPTQMFVEFASSVKFEKEGRTRPIETFETFTSY